MPVQKSAAACACARHPLSRCSPLTGQGADRPAGKNAALAKKKLAKGWGCLYTPFCAERSAPWQGSSVGQSMRFIPAVSRVQISPLLPESNNPGCPQGVRGFRVVGFLRPWHSRSWPLASAAQPCPPSALAGTPLFNVRCARRAGPSAREDRQSGRRLPPSQA